MNSISLYTLSAQVEQMLESETAFDPETGEMSADLVTALEAVRDKGVAVAAYTLNLEALVKAMEDHEKQISARRIRLANKSAKLREYLAQNMKRTGVSEITAVDGSFHAKLYAERDASVEIFDERQIPANFMSTPKPPEPKPDKRAISAAIKAGAEVPGAKIVKRDRLVIE
jgi:hypothetical protein